MAKNNLKNGEPERVSYLFPAPTLRLVPRFIEPAEDEKNGPEAKREETEKDHG